MTIDDILNNVALGGYVFVRYGFSGEQLAQVRGVTRTRKLRVQKYSQNSRSWKKEMNIPASQVKRIATDVERRKILGS